MLLCFYFELKSISAKLSDMDDVVVVGGGIIGASTAYFLSKEGRKAKS